MAKKKKAPLRDVVGAAEFKARCLELMDRVHETGAEYVITKHGEPVARVVPATTPRASLHGVFAGRIRITGDIVETDWHTEWDAAR